MDVEQAALILEEYVSPLHAKSTDTLDIPVRSDGTEYLIEDLADDQKMALAAVVSKIRDYCSAGLMSPSETLSLTVSGVAGSGKSTWINTLVTVVRRLFNTNDSIGVYGPTGSAAFNAGGETMNRGFRIPIDIKTLEINAATEKYLLNKFRRTICLVIDERSLVEANKLGLIKHYMTQCAHLARNKNQSWGGIPIVILVGDDYQLPAIGYGAFYALEPIISKETKKINSSEVSCRLSGFEEFRESGRNVLYLNPIAKRVNSNQEQLRRILKGLRCEEEADQLLEEDIQRLLALDINHPSFSKVEREEIKASSMYLFALKEPRDAHNRKMLLKANFDGNPVARIKSRTVNGQGKQATMASHFDNERTPNLVLLCKTAKVALHGCNPAPAMGLYHSTLGVVQDIVYRSGQSPNIGDLPAYVLVLFDQYCGKELVAGHSKSVPVVPISLRCKFKCCTRMFMPLSLAYGKTVHTFQGQSVGPVPAGRPSNSIQRIIVEPGNRTFEGNNVGLFYTTASRPTTIGTSLDKMSSAMYFDGPDFSRARITNLTRQKNGKLYVKAILRQKWVSYLKGNSRARKGYTKGEQEDLFTWVSTQRFNPEQLDLIVQRHAAKKAEASVDTIRGSCNIKQMRENKLIFFPQGS